MTLSLYIALGIILGEFGNRLLTYFFSRLEHRRLIKLHQSALAMQGMQGQALAQQQFNSNLGGSIKRN